MSVEALRLVTLLDVEGRLLAATTRAELTFIAVNETHAVTPYRQAALWSAARGVETVSGLAVPDRNAPFLLWLEPVMRDLAARHAAAAEVTAANLPPSLAEHWADWLPAYGLFLPWGAAALLLVRDQPWDAADRLLAQRLSQTVTALWRGFDPPTAWNRLRRHGWHGRRGVIAAAVAIVVAAALPVTGSVLAPADMVPAHPAAVRAPVDGVVDRLHVQPNDRVAEGQPLFDLDPTTLQGKLDVARQEQATAEAEYRQTAQAQVFDPKAKAQVAILKSRLEEHQAQTNWLENQLARIHVKSPRAGMAVLDDPSEWIGHPITVGEKVMLVADETDTEVEAWLAVADVGEVRPGAALTLFLNTAPLSPLHAVVRTVAYEAQARPDGSLAHRVRANLQADTDKPRLGLKGTARIDGERMPLVWWLFRRPLSATRQSLGF
jgi:multidrug resistance efflux pump